MKILTTYYSWTGNTKKIAQAINEELGGDLEPFSNVSDLESYDFIAVGFFVDRGFANKEAKSFMEKIKNKKVGVFATLGAKPTSEHAKNVLKNAREFFEANENEIITEFICQGEISKEIISKIMQMAKKQGDKAVMPITKERLAVWESAKSHPDEEDMKNAKKAFSNLKF